MRFQIRKIYGLELNIHKKRTMLNYHHLRYFWIVAHEGNLTRAAQNINISQSALSMQISALETDLGQSLFERTGRRLILTEAGRIVLDFADVIFGKGEELESTLHHLAQHKHQHLRVGAIATLSRNFQIGFLGNLLAQDGVHISILSGTLVELMENLEGYRIDVVLSNIVPLHDDTTRWVAYPIDRQPVSLIGPPTEQPIGSISVATLLANRPLVIPASQSSIRIGFDALIHRLGIEPHIVAEVDDMAMLRLVARQHEGLAVVPPIVVKDELDSGVLVEIAALPDLEETFFAITLQRQFPNPLLQDLLPKSEEL